MIALEESALLESDLNFALRNWHLLESDSTFRAKIWERKFAELIGGEFVDQAGYDILHPVYGRVEVKTSFSWHVKGSTVAFEALKSKHGKCDYFLFYSDILKQTAFIKHDDLFRDGVLYKYPNGSLAFRVKVKELKLNVKKKSCAVVARELWDKNLVQLI
jgi:hypothetical protein